MGGLLGGGPSIDAPKPPPPPPPAANPPTIANSSVQGAGQAQRARLAAAAGSGFSGTLMTGGQGAAAAPTTGVALTGQ